MKEYRELDPVISKDFQYKGYRCIILWQGEMGHFCGYVVLPKDSGYREYGADDLVAHGGITFQGEPNNWPFLKGEYLIGFDCAHAGDKMYPHYQRVPLLGKFPLLQMKDVTFRNIPYVEQEIRDLVDQLEAPHELIRILEKA